MAGKHGGKLIVEAKNADWYGRLKRMVGVASTTGVIAFFVVPGPHTVVLVGGLVAGVVVAKMTGKKNS